MKATHSRFLLLQPVDADFQHKEIKQGMELFIYYLFFFNGTFMFVNTLCCY